MTARRQAIAYMLVATVLTGMDAILVRFLAGEVSAPVIGFFRSAFGLIAVLPWILCRGSLSASPFRMMHLARAGLKALALVMLFASFAHAPLADATAINFTMPIFLVLGAWTVFGERPGRVRLAAILAAFAGTLVILRPAAVLPDPWLACALGSALLMAASQLFLRYMALRDSSAQLVAWNLVAMVPLGLLIALPVWSMPSHGSLALLALQGALGAVSMTCLTRAFALAEPSVLAPLDYLRLPVVAVLAFMLFGEAVQTPTLIGAAFIAVAAMVASRAKAGTRRCENDGGRLTIPQPSPE